MPVGSQLHSWSLSETKPDWRIQLVTEFYVSSSKNMHLSHSHGTILLETDFGSGYSRGALFSLRGRDLERIAFDDEYKNG